MRHILLVLITCLTCTVNAQNIDKRNSNIFDYPWLNERFPISSLISYSNDTLLLSESEDIIYVISFWYSSCPPCIAEIPALNKLKNSYTATNVEFIAISFDKKNDIDKVLERHPFNFQMYHLDQDVITKNRLTIGYPTNLILDNNLIVRFQKSGGSTDPIKSSEIFEILDKEIKKLKN